MQEIGTSDTVRELWRNIWWIYAHTHIYIYILYIYIYIYIYNMYMSECSMV